jgi:hypothetical protein
MKKKKKMKNEFFIYLLYILFIIFYLIYKGIGINISSNTTFSLCCFINCTAPGGIFIFSCLLNKIKKIKKIK